jgi:hypothetical protein
MPQPRNTQTTAQTPESPQGDATPPAQTAGANGQVSQQDTWADALLTDGDALATEKTQLFERIGANREMLRNLKKSGKLSADRVKRIDTMYPERDRKPRKKKNADQAPADQAQAPTPAATSAGA